MNNVDTIKFELIDMITEAYNNIVSLSDDSQVKVFEAMMNDDHFINKPFLKLAALKKMKDLNRAMSLGRSMNFNENEGLFVETIKNVEEGCKFINETIAKL